MQAKPATGIFVIVAMLCVGAFLGCGRSDRSSRVTIGPDDERDWNQWRGPTGNGVAVSRDAPTQWDGSTNIRWRTEIPGRGHGSPTVCGDRVFVPTALKDQQQQRVICLDRADGSVRWTTTIHEGEFPADEEIHPKATHANTTIACNGHRVFTTMFHGGVISLTALDLEGQLVWQQTVDDFQSDHGYAASPTVYRDLVIVVADNSGGGRLTAFSAETGEVVWEVDRGQCASHSSPIVARLDGTDQLLLSACGGITSYDPQTGDALWRTPCIAPIICGTVVTGGNRVFASGGFPEKETVCLSSTGEILWSNSTKVYEPSMLVVGDRLLAVTDDGRAICWSAATGEQLWRHRLGGGFSGSPVLCGDRVYASNLDGDTFVFHADEDFELISRNRLGADCYSTPAIAGGQIFQRIGIGSGEDRTEEVVCIAED